MNKAPLITVYLTTKNRCKLLKRAIESVLKQDFTDFELIVIDDASSDNTVDYLKVIQKQDSRVRYFSNKESKGACYGRNLAISNANGVYITGLDDDDEFTKERLSMFISLKSYLDKGYSGICASLLFSHSNKKIKRQHSLGKISIDKILHKNVIGNQIFTYTERLKKIGGFDIKMPAMQDYDTWVRLIYTYGDVYKIKDITYIVHTEHEEPRITCNSNRKEAVDLFNEKHKAIMEKSHLKAAEMHRIICYREKLLLSNVVDLFTFHTYPELFKYYIFSNFSKLEKLKFWMLGLKAK